MFTMFKFFLKSFVAFALSFFVLNIPVDGNTRVFHLISKNVSINYTQVFKDVRQGAEKGLEQGKKITKEYTKEFLKNNIENIDKKPSSKNATKVHYDNYTDEEREFVRKILESN